MSSYTIPLLINGENIVTKNTFDVISPSTSECIWRCSSATVDDARAAVTAAGNAFPAWSKTKPAFRRDILLRAADILTARADECADYMMQETGAAHYFSRDFNVPLTADVLRDLAGRISGIMGSIPTPAAEGANALVYKEPYGVVLGIAPWNAPFVLGLRSIIYPLAAGNTCVLKGSELSPRVFWAIGDVLREAGLPDGCLNVIYHRTADAAAVTTALIEDPLVKKVNFTGSTAVGRIIASQAGKNLKPVLMELGGKASAIVLDDADVQRAAEQCALGAFLHSGQICMSTERILVHKAIMAEFIPALQAAVTKAFPTDKPAPILIQPAGVTKNKSLISNAVENGAKILHGDPNLSEASNTRLRPIIVGDVTEKMDIYKTESFGPSVSVIEVQSEEEAVRIANDTEYGLSAAVFTENLNRGLRVAKQIESGAVHINSMSVHDESALPHGGVKASGWGRFNATWGLEEFLRTKTITFQD
ncbi:aldehyde dehydrogenase [Pseudovirgaria hyperparasitica]|uniref:Aldehyde dehydrogenase n=1 Tax=Pseudovirgaria hyperparasitica TaxID=470096 RepID=A0A6A6VXE2_9PEZI|nr:aldehyde dehydrogenase [Pseudovirgaria hyperparasitica]KAF2755338.1 aldehyde dehydrogenase [Pseudovirgaria hyperparasitica]